MCCQHLKMSSSKTLEKNKQTTKENKQKHHQRGREIFFLPQRTCISCGERSGMVVKER
jgi:hypothetical protein